MGEDTAPTSPVRSPVTSPFNPTSAVLAQSRQASTSNSESAPFPNPSSLHFAKPNRLPLGPRSPHRQRSVPGVEYDQERSVPKGVRPGSSRTKHYIKRLSTLPSSDMSKDSSNPLIDLDTSAINTAYDHSRRPGVEVVSGDDLIDLDEPYTGATQSTQSTRPQESLSTLNTAFDDIDMEATHAPYRSPEAVIEPLEEHPPGYVPGVIAEHPFGEDDLPPSSPLHSVSQSKAVAAWQEDIGHYENMDLDTDFKFNQIPDRPQLGRGVLPRRVLQIAHQHEMLLPRINAVPQRGEGKANASTASSTSLSDPSTLKSPQSTVSAPDLLNPLSPMTTGATSATAPIPSTPGLEPVATLADVWDSLPGGQEQAGQWYFCPTCWAWLRIVAGTDESHGILNMEEWEAACLSLGIPVDQAKITSRHKEWSKYNDLKASRLQAETPEHHLHEFNHLLIPTNAQRVERAEVDDSMNVFPHVTFGVDNADSWSRFNPPNGPPRFFASCSSDLWVIVDKGMIPGQLPVSLVYDFSSEKMGNPIAGLSGQESVNEAWQLVHTLLTNPLFKSQKGWVKLDNKKFTREIGPTLASSCLLYNIGFGCKQDADALRVGPISLHGPTTEEGMNQMNRYMLRTWVEIGLHLAFYQHRNSIPAVNRFVEFTTLTVDMWAPLNLTKYHLLADTVPDKFRASCHELGVTQLDVAETMERAYELQIACDSVNTKHYLTALEHLSTAPIADKDRLSFKVATERSLDKYTTGELNHAYALIGYDAAHVTTLGVEACDAPEYYILDLHKKAVLAADGPDRRAELGRALAIIGTDKGSTHMINLGRSGKTDMSVDDAYSALSAPKESIDDGLIMQYEMAVNEYPGKLDHYRLCLKIIAEAAGAERPAIKSFLETGTLGEPAPKRNDIPVGLHNIGNTCYLNSILQYLYSIKPLREAVIAFDQTASMSKTPLKPEVERSRRFVLQLRLLFLQLYKSEQAAVRPDEELAYLAITRPEVDQIVSPQPETAVPQPLTFDSIPDMPSPSSTYVATPGTPHTPMASLPSSPRPGLARSSSVLGKRASEDREDMSSGSDDDRSRIKSDGFEDLGYAETVEPMDTEEFELIPKVNGVEDRASAVDEPEQMSSPSATTDIAALKLKSPELEDVPVTDKLEVVAGHQDILSVPPPLPPRPAIGRKDTLASGLRFGLQQDSAEVLINVLTQLEMAFDPATAEDGAKGSNLISDLFSCKFRQQTFYEATSGQVEAQTPVESVFVHPIIGVEEEGKDLYDCLAELYLGGADIEYEGKKGFMMDLMDEFPPMLYIQMRRSQYDPTTGRERKTNTHIAFEQTLVMDRYLSTADQAKREESIEITREMVRIRTRLHQLKNHKPMSIPDTFKHASEALRALDDQGVVQGSSDFWDALKAEGEETSAEIAKLEESLPTLKRKLDSIWDTRHFEYDLVSVFMHRGKTSGAGHYWTYQSHLPDQPDKFFKYNDEQVTEVPASEVLEDRTGSDANPALLCYVRRGMDLVDVLHREVMELERARVQDEILEVGMKDGTGAGGSVEVPPATLHSVETLETNDDKQLIELD